MISTSPQPPALFVLDTALRAEREFWVTRLSAGIEPAGPPRDSSGERNAGPVGSWRRELPADLARRLHRLSGGSPLLLFAAVTAGLAACLTRWTGRRRVLLGSPALAASPAAPPNAVALLVEITPEAPFRRFLLETRDVLREAYARQRYPWSRLEADLGGGAGAAPRLRVVAMLAGFHGELPEDAGCELVLRFSAAEGRLAVEVTDRRGLYPRSGLERFLCHWEAGLSAALADVERPLRSIDWLSDPERHQLRCEWPAGAGETAPAEYLHRLIAEQAAAKPENVAVIAGERRITYRDLDHRANLLAHRLVALGVRAESRVGVLLERSCELIVALLAVLKAGAAYVPLDPALPGERLRFLLADSRASLLLTESTLLDRHGAGGTPFLCVDRVDFTAAGAGAPAAEVSPDSIAYVIYTSGSTGRPKGVMVPHRGLVNYLRWCAEAYEVAAGVGTPMHTSIGFDLTVTSLWSPLVSGRYVWLLPGDSPAEALVAARAGGFMLSLAKITPAHLELLLGTLPDPGLAAGARFWVLGGEALRAEQVGPWREQAPDTRWINEYGPTETVVGCCVHEVGPADPRQGVLPIGRPIAGAILRLLSPDLSLVPVGETGELFVGGAGVARGYWGQPALTAERFVPDAWGYLPGARLYRTGDLAVHRPDGVLVYLGRQDGQVKIRGHRIELAEIESVLVRHPAVRAAVVMAREDVAGQKRLVAYVVPEDGALPPLGELRAHLGASLPEPMVPSAFVVLPAWPLTPNGKVDRDALPAPASAGRETEDGEGPALRPLEEILGGIWAEVLGVERVGRGDNFFDLGGHSLLASQVVARLRRTLRIELPVRTFFEVPNLAGFATAVEARLRPEWTEAASAESVERIARDGQILLSFAQQRLWFLEHLRAGTALCNLPLALKIEGTLRPDLLRLGLDEVVRRHEPLRTVFPMGSGEPVQRILCPSPLSLPLVDLSGLPRTAAGREGARLVMEEARRPFDMERGPLLRVSLLRLGVAEHTLAIVMHHIVSDGWSLRVLVRELTALYAAFAAGAPSPLRELSYQYADFAAWQRRRFAAGGMDEHLRYWQQRFAGQTAVAALPADRRRPEVRSYRGALLEIELASGALAPLKRLSRSEGVTLFMVLLAALQVVLRHRTSEDRVVVGTDVASRSSVETEAMIGFFVNQLVLVTDLSGDPTFRDLLVRAREAALGAYAHQDLPFDRIVEALNLRRDLKHTTLFQTKLIFQNLPAGAIELPGLSFTPITLDSGTAQLDLTLAFWEAGDTLRGWVNYSTDLFDEGSILQLRDALRAVLEAVLEQPDVRLGRLDMALSKMFKRNHPVEKSSAAKPSPFKNVKPKSVSLGQSDQLVATGLLKPGQELPLVFTPQIEDLDLPEWAASHRKELEAQLGRHGALLFRGFKIDSPEVFERFAAAVCDELFNENGEHPRENVTGNVYTPVFYPPDKQLLWHNENSFNHRWPSKILFCCMEAPPVGGETPIVDSRRVFSRIAPEIRDRFVDKGVLYTRSYGNGLGLTWQEVFQTTSKDEVEERCREEGFEVDWRDRDTLRTGCRRPAAVLHPGTAEPVWFNQAQHWHVSCLDPETRESILSLFSEDGLPRNCYYGDGTPISDADMDSILDVYRELEVSFPWQPGDILMLDNLLTAHGRNAFSGRRKILVALGDMKSFNEVIDPGVR
jgi:amino acid adenylation domain-containing protein